MFKSALSLLEVWFMSGLKLSLENINDYLYDCTRLIGVGLVFLQADSREKGMEASAKKDPIDQTCEVNN